MTKVRIELTDGQARRLHAEARKRAITVSQLIRHYVEKGLSAEESDRAVLYARAARLIGRFGIRGDARDISTEHDRYLDETFE
jgi:hypothetical protein